MGELIKICIISYFIGNFSPSYILGKITGSIDIRQYGSGNAGATNTLRVLGKKAGFLVFILDFLKGFLTVLFIRNVYNLEYAMIAAIFVISGHIFPVLLKFRGGKGASASIGAYFCLFPIRMGICSVICLGLLAITRYVSLSSMLVVTMMIPVLYFTGFRQFTLYAIIIAFLLIFSHRGNVKRLIRGDERKLGEKK